MRRGGHSGQYHLVRGWWEWCYHTEIRVRNNNLIGFMESTVILGSPRLSGVFVVFGGFGSKPFFSKRDEPRNIAKNLSGLDLVHFGAYGCDDVEQYCDHTELLKSCRNGVSLDGEDQGLQLEQTDSPGSAIALPTIRV